MRKPKSSISPQWTRVPRKARLWFLHANIENYHFDYDIAYNWFFCVGSDIIAIWEALISFGVLRINFVVVFFFHIIKFHSCVHDSRCWSSEEEKNANHAKKARNDMKFFSFVWCDNRVSVMIPAHVRPYGLCVRL